VGQFRPNFHIWDEKWQCFIFEPPLGALGVTYNVYLRLIGMRVVDLLLVLIELFLLGVMAEALRVNID